MVRDTIVMLGGVATWGQLVAVHGDAPVRAAVRRGEVERTARGRYSRPGIPDLQRFAHANHAIVSGLSAAESAARALTVRAVDLPFRPQLQVCDSGLFATVDLGNEELRIAIEVEGYAFHGGPREFARDCLRYTELVAFGWLVVRLTYTDIVHHPTWSMWAIDATVRQRRNQPISSPPSRA